MFEILPWVIPPWGPICIAWEPCIDIDIPLLDWSFIVAILTTLFLSWPSFSRNSIKYLFLLIGKVSNYYDFVWLVGSPWITEKITDILSKIHFFNDLVQISIPRPNLQSITIINVNKYLAKIDSVYCESCRQQDVKKPRQMFITRIRILPNELFLTVAC